MTLQKQFKQKKLKFSVHNFSDNNESGIRVINLVHFNKIPDITVEEFPREYYRYQQRFLQGRLQYSKGFVKKYTHVFDQGPADLQETNMPPYSICMKSDKPIAVVPYRLSTIQRL